MSIEQAITDLTEVIAFHRDHPFQPLKLSAVELEAVIQLAKSAPIGWDDVSTLIDQYEAFDGDVDGFISDQVDALNAR
ncbi:hypothetical protein SEA_WATERT_119 [Microbacterium phage WaterT]|nr:hypothetical protein SEA_WATERT_119 [Microbacterium phage WaterT]